MQDAAELDPLNEDVARAVMRSLAAIGDYAGIRAHLQRLRAALNQIDEEPSAETIALAACRWRNEITPFQWLRERPEQGHVPG